MVSKLAVAACVLIIAVPILLGFGLNFEETTDTRYVAGSETNVTQLLRTSTTFDYNPVNAYELNGRNLMYTTDWVNNPPYSDDFKMFPLYTNYTANPTSLPLEVTNIGNGTPNTVILDDCYSYALEVTETYDAGHNQLITNVYNSGGSVIGIIPHTHIIDYDSQSGKIFITMSNGSGVADTVYSYTTAAKISFTLDNYTGTSQITYQAKSRDPYSYADITGGWKLDRQSLCFWEPPAPMSEFLFTIDLSTFTGIENLPVAEYTFRLHVQDETEINSMVSERSFSFKFYDGNWYYHQVDDDHKLIYDPALASNTYQVYFTKEYYEIRYVGAWPNTIGEANYYRVWHEDDDVLSANLSWARILVRNDVAALYSIVPTMRFDYAAVKGATYPVIEDNTYNPAQTIGSYNTVTKISSITKLGSSLVFGGITYPVKDGKITLEGRSIPVNNLEFSSVQSGLQYENKIGNTVISTTATASTLYFGGVWAANVTTAPLTSETYTVNEWVPGHFAWDLWHSNDFLLVGLMTSLACFIGLAIYGAKSGKKVGGLLLICGGAAFAFLILM